MEMCAYDILPGDRLLIDGESRRVSFCIAFADDYIEIMFDDGGQMIFNELDKVVLDNE